MPLIQYSSALLRLFWFQRY